MNIEQTNQLIQLILNSVVMVAACIFLLGGLLRRQAAMGDRLQHLHQEYLNVLGQSKTPSSPRLTLLKRQLYQLRRHHRATYYSVLAVHYALLFLVGSTFFIALRTVLGANELITTALVLFIIGVGILLLGVGLALGNVYGDRSLWSELRWLLRWNEGSDLSQPRRTRRTRARKLPQLSPKAATGRSPQTRVG
jgi:Protein of unknown function (DUF2721)